MSKDYEHRQDRETTYEEELWKKTIIGVVLHICPISDEFLRVCNEV